MKVWKQLLLCIVVLVAAAAAWILLVPSARQTLAGLGFQWADAATSRQSQAASGGGGRSGPRPAPAVVTEAVGTATINDRLQAIGTGRANATVFFLSQGIAPIGALLAGAIASASSARFTLLIAIMGFFCIAVWLLTTPARQVQAVSGHSRTEDVPMEESV